MSSREEELLAERDLLHKRFPREHRLRKSKEFKTVFSKGKKVITPTLIFHAMPTELDHCRLGLAVSRKVGKAVKRNKVKRRIREAFRLQHGSFPASFDLVVYPRRGVLEKTFDDYLQAFQILCHRVGKSKRQKESRDR